MKQYPKPDFEEFLVQIAYGPCTDYLSACVAAPYLDFCRTMHGFGTLRNKDQIRKTAFSRLLSSINNIAAQPPRSQEMFDRWHQDSSETLIREFRKGGFDVYAGQSQKWINIALKYIFVCGKKRISGFQSVYRFCHMPIDNVVLRQLPKDMTRPSKAWSRWNYEEYFLFQKQLREFYGGQPLLNVEHQLWIDGR